MQQTEKHVESWDEKCFKVTWLQENALNSGKESDSRKNVNLGEKVLQKRKKYINVVRQNEKVMIMKRH